MVQLSSKQFRVAFFAGVLVYAALIAGLFGWLIFNGEETTQRRAEKSPSVTISLAGNEAAVPSSWTDEKKPEEVATPAVVPPATETPPVTPEVQPADATAMPPVAEEKKDEAKPAETPAPAAEAKPEEAKPAEAVATPPVTAEAVPPAVETNPAEAVVPDSVAAAAATRPTWQRYARPFTPSDQRPRIGLIITDLGFAQGATQSAVQDLPGDITLAFSALAPDIEEWIANARAAGHEVLLTVPMEPDNYPQNDPGPNTLLTSLPDKDNITRLRWALSRADGYVAVMPSMGEKFVQAENKLVPVLDVIKDSGLMFVDNTMSKNSLIAPLSRLGKVPFVRTDILVDAAAARTAINDQLAKLEELAKARGQAIGIALPYPVTFEQLKPWIESLDKKGFVLAPITAMASEEIPVVSAEPASAETSVKAGDSTESLTPGPKTE